MCTYCGCESIAVIGRFMAEHTDIINAAGQLRRACHQGDQPEVERAADEVARLLDPHTDAEEVGLFRVMRQQEEFADHIEQLCLEHETLDAQLAAIRAGDHARMAEFDHDLRGHIEREDNGLFPASAIALDGPDWAEVDLSTPPPTTWTGAGKARLA
ncbi:MAG: hemerythrin domain-containing protein [Ornithinimicrobium sp.]|uniref:hemerythrin domain-containing protein n=1 Tax=Ornithinimicrobium sp. TaxID=1977084 RepID=UPI0026E06BFC|nr:hemerythrin domain-containing protein [Ornithinimicrobium sp.]MDO5739019.1 hemerythrin domain-containing protein [Ornithinimicrobium sp.]